ncbi:MAG: cache domain-containing protein, partial [Oscillospiraceae bacterium]
MCAKDKKPLIVAVVVTVIFAILSLLYAGYITDLLTSESQMHLSEVATQGAASVQRQVARDFDILEVLADGSIADPNVPLSAKIERIKKQATKFDLFRIGIVDLKGNAITSDDHEFSVSDREFFKSAVEGKRFISQPIIDKVDKVTPGIVYAVPVYNEGEVASVLFSGYELDKLTERIDISFYHESGIAFITDSSGKILLHPNKDRIGRNIVEVAMVLNKRDEVEKFKNDLLSGASGVSHFKMKEEDRFFAYAPIKGANDWFLLTSLPAVSVFERSQKVILFTVILLVSIAVIFAIVVAYIVVTKKKSNERIIKLAYYDQLTGAPNAECFKIEARDLCNKFEEEKYTLLNFDVRQFRYLNNDLGYEAGNHLLIHIADCLANTVSRDETYARVGNDQFLLLVSIGNDGEQMRKYIYDLYEKIAKWQQPTGGYYSINMNFGVYKLNSEDTDIMSAMEKSNIARKSTKVGHETDIAVYDTAMQIKIDQDTELEKSMPKALENGEFKLYIQPKYDLLSERIVGGEALVRWVKADGTMIMPDEFISLFEQT